MKSMKKILSVSPIILCVLYAFLPICSVLDDLVNSFGYRLILRDEFRLVFSILLAALSVIVPVLLLSLKIALNHTQTVFVALLLPLSAINVVFLLNVNWIISAILVLACCLGSFVLWIRYTHSFSALTKIALLGFSGILLYLNPLIIAFFPFFKIFASDISRTAVKSLASPQNTYTAYVIDSNQGDLDGNTRVLVYDNTKQFDLFFCELKKLPLRVYEGEWMEYETMQISWQDE